MIWITGASGMLGSEVITLFKSHGLEYAGTDIEVDITNKDEIELYLNQNPSVRWIVNCAAYTNVDAAEDDEAAAFALNAIGPKLLAEACRDRGIAMLHISTDYVFDGTKATPYTEDDFVAPTTAYGRTKAAGEEQVRATVERHVIVRTAWLYGRYGKNFVETMLRMMNDRDVVKVIADQVGSPTNAEDIARAIERIVTSSDPDYGTYHYTGLGPTSWFGFAQKILELGRHIKLISRNCSVHSTTSAEFAARAPRPAFSLLECSRIAAVYGVGLFPWEQSLERYLKKKAQIK